MRTADVSFTGAMFTRWVETSTTAHNVPDHGSSDYDDRAAARAARDATVVKLREVASDG